MQTPISELARPYIAQHLANYHHICHEISLSSNRVIPNSLSPPAVVVHPLNPTLRVTAIRSALWIVEDRFYSYLIKPVGPHTLSFVVRNKERNTSILFRITYITESGNQVCNITVHI